MLPLIKALEIAKSFASPRKKPIENEVSPQKVLRYAWVDKQYVWASDSYTLIRIAHDSKEVQPHLHPYHPNDAEYLTNNGLTYPNPSLFIPDYANCHCQFSLQENEIKTWQKTHELAKIFKETAITLNTETKTFSAVHFHKSIVGGKMTFMQTDVPMLDKQGDIRISYQANNMLNVFKALKKLKEKDLHISTNNNMAPIKLEGNEVLFLIVPTRPKP